MNPLPVARDRLEVGEKLSCCPGASPSSGSAGRAVRDSGDEDSESIVAVAGELKPALLKGESAEPDVLAYIEVGRALRPALLQPGPADLDSGPALSDPLPSALNRLSGVAVAGLFPSSPAPAPAFTAIACVRRSCRGLTLRLSRFRWRRGAPLLEDAGESIP